MLKIRLSKVGRKHEPVFRLVLTDSKEAARSSKIVEVLGSYDSRRGEKASFDGERVKYWISKGAQTSPTVHNILVSNKTISGSKISVLPKGVIEKSKKGPEVVAEPVSEEAPAAPEESKVEEAEAVVEEKPEGEEAVV